MGPIGVFDSGYGGLTVLNEFTRHLPQYDYLYLGDNARAPYGTRSLDMVYRYTLECVEWLLKKNCPLVILACNTASANALTNIQKRDLERLNPKARVLGVIRPTAEIIGSFTQSNHIGVMATKATVFSESYLLEIKKFHPHVQVTQEACPMWVPLAENNEHQAPGADYFIQKHLESLLHSAKNAPSNIDTILLACTHYPLLQKKIREFLDPSIKLVSQAEIVAHSLQDYLNRHPEIETRLSKNSHQEFFTTDSPEDFSQKGALFLGRPLEAQKVHF
jgi:glutamate racemase